MKKWVKKWVKLALLLIFVTILFDTLPRLLPDASARASSFGGGEVLFLQSELSSKAIDYFGVVVYSGGYSFLIYATAVVFLWKHDLDGFTKYLWVFVISQALAVITWALYPVAPPRLAVDGVRPVRESLLGFTEIANPFIWGAFPSMHVANGLTAFLFVRKHGKGILGTWLGIWLLFIFSTIYLGEHYWQDVAAGCFYSLIPYLFVMRMSRKFPLSGR